MLDNLHITKSKIRRDLLTLYYTNPSKKYYLRELQRILGYSAGSLRRELLKFKKDNLLTAEKVGNLLYYSVNIKHPLFKELKSIISKTVGVEGSLKKVINDLDNIILALVYGSFAENKEASTSDIDLLIVGNVDEDKLMHRIENLEKKLQREINYNIYPKQELKARLKNRDSFIMNILKKPKIILKGNIDEIR